MLNLDLSVIGPSIPYLWVGLLFTLKLTIIAMIGGIVFGTLLALARLSSYKGLAFAAAGYVNLMRSIPLVMVILWFFLIIPLLTGKPLGAENSAIVTFMAFEAAYYSEIMRAGIQSISKGQVGAAFAIGLDYWQAMRLIVLPQAFRNMLPVLLTQTIILFQDVSLVSLLNVTDFVGAAGKIAQRDSRIVEMYLFVAIVYFVLCSLLSYGVERLQKRIAIIR